MGIPEEKTGATDNKKNSPGDPLQDSLAAANEKKELHHGPAEDSIREANLDEPGATNEPVNADDAGE